MIFYILYSPQMQSIVYIYVVRTNTYIYIYIYICMYINCLLYNQIMTQSLLESCNLLSLSLYIGLPLIIYEIGDHQLGVFFFFFWRIIRSKFFFFFKKGAMNFNKYQPCRLKLQQEVGGNILHLNQLRANIFSMSSQMMSGRITLPFNMRETTKIK